MSDEAFTWTEEDWLSCDDPDRILRGIDILVEQTGLSISERKWTLFMTACLRRTQSVFTDERSRQLVGAIERYADDLLTREQVDTIGSQAIHPVNPDNLSEVPKERLPPDKLRVSYAWDALTAAVPPIQGHDFPWDVISVVYSCCQASARPEEESQVQADLLRDIIGNPFHPASLDNTALTPKVVRLAHDAYENRSMPEGTLSRLQLDDLADALEEAGCADPTLLSHYRGRGPHVRGCWAVDLILGKK